jgi:hypothetical protein
MRKLFVVLAVSLLAVSVVACQKTEPQPAMPESTPAVVPDAHAKFGGAEPASRLELVAYLEKQLERAGRQGTGNQARLEMNLKQHFGCLEKNKADDCRFMLCSPPAIYAADEYFQMGETDQAFGLYTAAFNLIKEEVAASTEKRNQRDEEYQAKAKSGEVTADDERQYYYRQAILASLLFRNDAEVARLLGRMALVFDAQDKSEEAGNARTTADAFLQTAADEYGNYYETRSKLMPLLDPDDPQKGANYIYELKNLDEMMIVRHF